MFELSALRSTAVPIVRPSSVYAPSSVVAAVAAPTGWPFDIQFAKRAQSNQLTYTIGRFELSPPLFITV